MANRGSRSRQNVPPTPDPVGDEPDLGAPPPPPLPPEDGITLPPADPAPAPQGGNGHDSPPAPPAPALSEDDIERIRREATIPLQSRLDQVDAELSQLRQEREARLAAEDQARREAEEAERRAAEEDMSARQLLESERQRWREEREEINRRFEGLEAQRAREAAILDQERRLNAIRDYRERRIAEEADDIVPQMRDMVSGVTEEEIEASIEELKRRSASILESVAQAQGRPGMVPGPRVTHPPVGPMDQQAGQETLTAQDIAGMNLNEYSQVRDRLLGAVSRRVAESGPYGGR